MLINDLIEIGLTHQASDLHLSAGCPPLYRVDGSLQNYGLDHLSSAEIFALIQTTMTPEQKQDFSLRGELDYAFQTQHPQRLRANAFYQQRGSSLALRFISAKQRNFLDLHLPSCTEGFCHYANGLILVTGATGSGKSTTLSAHIEHINQTQAKHIITLEDPIEFIYENKLSLIQQRAINRDSKNFATALRMALRQDPDVIMLGEMRDKKTIRLALEAAETGHLIFATLHAASAIQAIDRMVQVFSATEQHFIRTLIAHSLRAVIAQELLPRKSMGRIAVYEVMIMTQAISHLIRENKLMQIYSVMQTNQQLGMQTKEQGLEKLKIKGELF